MHPTDYYSGTLVGWESHPLPGPGFNYRHLLRMGDGRRERVFALYGLVDTPQAPDPDDHLGLINIKEGDKLSFDYYQPKPGRLNIDWNSLEVDY